MTNILKTGLLNLLFTLYGLWVWLIFILAALIASLFLLITPDLANRRKLIKCSATISLTLSGFRINVRGLDQLSEVPGVLIANHASYLDGIVMAAILPARFQYVVKQEMENVPVAGYLLKRIGTQFVRRTHANRSAGDARRIMKAAKNQESIVFFPEGTFVAEPGLKKFHSGAFIIAASGSLPVTPAVIHGTRQCLPANKWLPRPGLIDVTIKAPHQIGNDAEDTEQLKLLCRQSILEDLNEPDTLQH